MTPFRVESLPFDREAIAAWSQVDAKNQNWPLVYAIQNPFQIYVGETLNGEMRFRQHLESPDKQHLDQVRVIIDDSFNKSACLDLESYLIRLFSGDGKFEVLNRNLGVTESNYFNRIEYRRQFEKIFNQLKDQELFAHTLPEIENSDLFKLSPFKSLTTDQAIAVYEILTNLFADIRSGRQNLAVVQGNPGTGKTVVGIYIMKMLSDIANYDFVEPIDEESIFFKLFTPDNVVTAKNLRVGLVVPQQSLRDSIQRVFRSTPGLESDQVLSPFTVGESTLRWDLLIVDEAHRLNQRANQSSAALNRKFPVINKKLFGSDDITLTQLNWIEKQSDSRLLLLDTAQTVKPADLPLAITKALIETAKTSKRHYPLVSQMRIRADQDYVGYIRAILSGDEVTPMVFGEYELRIFDDMRTLRDELTVREEQFGLCRMLAGYAWPWRSNPKLESPATFDIEIDGKQFKWNSVPRDWVNSQNSFSEVGSIHTIQGYDLNYAAVIIGGDLRFNPQTSTVYVERDNYFDKKGKENNPRLARYYSDTDLREFIVNIYTVLLTRGIRGTFIYVVDQDLRKHLSRFVESFPSHAM